MAYKILVIYDVSGVNERGQEFGWAYWRRANALKKYAPPDFEVDIAIHSKMEWRLCGRYNLVFNLEYAAPCRKKIKGHSPRPNVPLVVSFNSDSHRKHDLWDKAKREADFIICNNLDVFEARGRMRGTCCISNGVDSEIWRPTIPIAEREDRILWSGSTGASKGKGWEEVLRHLSEGGLAKRHGFECSFRPVNEMDQKIVLTTDKMVDWYNHGKYVVCASASEGTPGIVSEGVACGCIAVSVPVGNIREWGVHGENCVLVKRDPDEFIKGLLYARHHAERLSTAGSNLFRDQWSYGSPGDRAQYYFQTFRQIIENGAASVEPFSYHEKPWSAI